MNIMNLIICVVLFCSVKCALWIDERCDCDVHLYLHINNRSSNTIYALFKPEERFGTNIISSISNDSLILASQTIASVSIAYAWTDQNGCRIGCDEDKYSDNLLRLTAKTSKDDSLIVDTLITPCHQEELIEIWNCKGGIKEFCDTIMLF